MQNTVFVWSMASLIIHTWAVSANVIPNEVAVFRRQLADSRSPIIAVVNGGHNTQFLRADGTVTVTGDCARGNCGDAYTSGYTTWTQIAELSDVKAVSSGDYHTMVIKKDNTFWAAGSTGHGQTGLGREGPGPSSREKLYFLHFTKVPGFSAVEQVEAGTYDSFVLKSDGTVWATGYNAQGQLGIGAGQANTVHEFTQCVGLSGGTVKQISAAYYHTVVLKTDGTVFGTGFNSDGQLGKAAPEKWASFQKIEGLSGITQIAAGHRHTLALKSDGTVYGAGKNDFGQLGDGKAFSSDTSQKSFQQIKELSGIKAVGAGSGFSMVLKTDGTLWSAGKNDYSQLVNGKPLDQKFDKGKPVNNFAATVGGTGIKSFVSKDMSTVALTEDGSVLFGGGNNAGQAGNGRAGREQNIITFTIAQEGVPVCQASDCTKPWSVKSNPSGIACKAKPCKREECCDPQDTCEASDCPADDWVIMVAPAKCATTACKREECCDPRDTCEAKDCGADFVLKKNPGKCAAAACTQVECCDPRDTCEASDCAAADVLIKENPGKCAGVACTQDECCDPKVCAAGGVARAKVVCENFFEAKAGSTPCTKCAYNGNECCTRTPCTVFTLGNILLDTKPDKKPVASLTKDQLLIDGLTYRYAGCVEPSTVTFEAYEKDSAGSCDQKKSLSSVVTFIGATATSVAKMGLKIDSRHLTATSLGSAYSSSNGDVTLGLCVRARVRQTGREILFTENNFEVTYSTQGDFSVAMNVARKQNVAVNQDIGQISKITAYQCDSDYKKLQSPQVIRQDSPVVRICVEGESTQFVCDNIVTATFKQPANNINDALIVDGKIKSTFTEVAKQQQFCMLTALLDANYFKKAPGSDASLQVTVEGAAAMQFATRRLLAGSHTGRRLSDDGTFKVLLELAVETDAKQEGQPQSTKVWIMGQKDTAVGVYGIAVSTVMAMTMLM